MVATIDYPGESCLRNLAKDVSSSIYDNANDGSYESSVGHGVSGSFGPEPATNDSDSDTSSNKEWNNNNVRSIDIKSKKTEGTKESSNNETRSIDLLKQRIERFHEECDVDREIGPFYDAWPDVEESSSEDDAHYEWTGCFAEESDG